MTAINFSSRQPSGISGFLNSLMKPVAVAPLVTFRIGFGLLMFASTIRFWLKGWIDAIYIQPKFHFTYWGFEWVRPLSTNGMQLVFLLLALSALCIGLGFLYRLATPIFFLLFSYVELIDVTTYLNHYYFVSLIAFLLIWLPANCNYSLDVRLRLTPRSNRVPAWTVAIIRFQIAVVYVFAGLAKLDPDWLLQAQPMRIWLPSKSHLPVVGPYLHKEWAAYLFSWFGAAYDLLIAVFLLIRKTRPVAYGFVILFHLATALFFPAIGIFPYVMIVSSLIFLSGDTHEKFLSKIFHRTPEPHVLWNKYSTALLYPCLAIYVTFQVLFPLRFLFYPDRLFWTEQGFRFSWRVMLMEKSGIAYFRIHDANTHANTEVNNAEFLTPLQEKMMSTQPDLIVKYAHFLKKEFSKRGMKNPEVYAEVYVTLNGRRSTLFVDSSFNLASVKLSWKPYSWILPFKNQP